MITPDEIKKQASKWWKPFLQSHISDEQFFPKRIDRIGKVRPKDVTSQFQTLQQQIEHLYLYSKNRTGTGYVVKTEQQNFRRTGTHELPEFIEFETPDDYVSFIGKKKDWQAFLKNYKQVTETIFSLQEWTLNNCLWLCESKINWSDIMKVCQYFIDTPRPNLYPRQLPINVHTKFLEENARLLQSLLDFLIPEYVRNPNSNRFAERYFLKYDEPLIRVRSLDQALFFYNGSISDISIPLSNFRRIDLVAENIIITENKMNFLTLPLILSTMTIWSGGGFQVSYLKNIFWLQTKNIFYWGDIDEHGFQILHQIRNYYPKVKSLMMDKSTFEQFYESAVDGSRNQSAQLNLLTEQEATLYQHLKSLNSKNRLEQEKIPQSYVNSYLSFLPKK
ncbi:MAG: hypothetical protein KIT62_05720 [Cyclobacteriaceae bacterium]|nr:hypothetical protein [Cyclobacteriaceae bacterium]